MSTPLSSLDLQSFMTAHGIAGEILHLSVPTPTVETAAQALGVQPEQIVKSILFLVEAGPALTSEVVGADPCVCPSTSGRVSSLALPSPVLAIACGTAYIERRHIAARYGVGRKRVRLASPEEVLAISGYKVGGMPPFGHRQPLPTLLDRRVLDLSEAFAGGGEENAIVRLDPRDIARFTSAGVMDLTAMPDQENE
jgi:prolyl-tRNA editing enzyme YbaK/EbsC (Cys-tRNA(Pro) deacylase)